MLDNASVNAQALACAEIKSAMTISTHRLARMKLAMTYCPDSTLCEMIQRRRPHRASSNYYGISLSWKIGLDGPKPKTPGAWVKAKQATMEGTKTGASDEIEKLRSLTKKEHCISPYLPGVAASQHELSQSATLGKMHPIAKKLMYTALAAMK
jgi:hypothetical protein